MKVLIIRLSSIGDVLLTTPVVRCLKKQMPDVELDYLTKRANVEMLESSPYLRQVVVLGADMGETIEKLRSERYDYIIDLHNNHRSRRIRRALRVKCKVYRKENLRKFIYIFTKRNVMSGRHVVDRYFGAVNVFGVKNDGEGLDLFLPKELEGSFSANLKWNDISVGQFFQEPYIAIACGAQHMTKRIPVQYILKLCNMLQFSVILLGDGKDMEELEAYSTQFPPNVVNLCGKTTLTQSALIVREAAVLISSDTGLMHMGAAFKRPVLAVWGATAPPLGFTPYKTEYYSFEVKDLHCHPCSRQGGERCRKGHFKCMNCQNWRSVALKAEEIVTRKDFNGEKTI